MSDLPDRYPGLQINNFIVMPNHVHAIFLYENIVNTLMDTSVGAALAAAHTKITDIIGAYKSLVTVNILNYIKTNQENRFLGKLWQRSFFDTIIKDHDSYIRMFNYIEDNPSNWKNDEFYVIIK
jgi:REP element-mobilizing transposase RayT